MEASTVKRILLVAGGLLALATAASGADVYTPAPAVAPPLFNWSGFYVGGNIGGSWENFNVTDNLTGASFSSNTRSAFTGGVQVGFNYQVSPFVVLGVDGLADGISNNNNSGAGVIIPGIGLVTDSLEPAWVATLAGRIGFTGPGFDRWLFYAKAGGGWVQLNETLAGPFNSIAGSRTASGWMAGAGIEWAFAPNFTARLDYQYIGLENTALASGLVPPSGFVVPDTFTTRNANLQTLTVGVNYLFNWWGAPRY
jgi:outer membrane immunogenic protein